MRIRSPLSAFVKRKRKESKLTQLDLSKKAGVGLRFVRDLEQGKKSLRMDTANKILILFGSCLGVIRISLEEDSGE